MNKVYFIAVIFVFTVFLFSPRAVLSQQEERVAVVSTFDGEVRIQHDGVWKTVTRIGNRTRNSAVYNDDTVLTTSGSTAVLIFNDNTRMDVSEDSTMIISEKQITDEMVQQGYVTPVSGTLKKDIVRRIKIKAGGLWADVTPSKSILTEFETPTGVASVRGTTVSFDEQPDGSFAVRTIEGLMGYVTLGDDPVTFDIGGGDNVTIGMPVAGRVELNVNSGNIEVNTPMGDVVNMNVGDGVAIGQTGTGDTSVTVTAVGADGSVTVDTDAGTVDMGADDAVEIGETDDGNTTVAVTATGTDGGVTLDTVEGTVTIGEDASLEVEIDPGTGEITVTGVTGDVVMTNEDGTTMTIEAGTSLGIMYDDGHDGSMEPNDGYDGPMEPDDGQDGHGEEEPEDGTFEGNITEADGGKLYEGVMTDEFGMWSGSYNDATDQFIGTFEANDGNTYTFLADGTILDQNGNTYNQRDFQSKTGNTNDGNTNDGNTSPNPPPEEVTFDDVPQRLSDQPVNNENTKSSFGVNFGYKFAGEDNTDATYKSAGPALGDVDGKSIEGKSGGTLSLTFNVATPLVSFGSALSTGGDLTSGFTVRLFDGSGNLISTANRLPDGSGNLIGTANTVKNVDTTGNGTWSEEVFNHVGSLVKRVTIDYNYNGVADPRFVFDNLYYTKSDNFFDDFQSTKIGSWWNHKQLNASTRTSFGSDVIAKSGNTGDRFATIHTGGGGVRTGKLGIDFNFAEPATRHISFDYNFITTEFGGAFHQNDTFTAKLILLGNDVKTLVSLTSSVGGMTDVSGLTALLDTDNGGQTGWQTYGFDWNIPAGLTQLVFEVKDTGDNIKDSAALIDNVLDPIVVVDEAEAEVTPSSTDYMLTFAMMLRGDIDIHDADLEADAEASAEHQAFIAKVNEVITDMENISSDSEFMAGKGEFFDRLWFARDTLADHEDTTEFLQETGVAHHLLEASIMATEDVNANITAITDSINQAKTFLVAHVNDFGETDALANIKTNIESVLANIENVNNNEFTTATMVAIKTGIKKAFSDTIDHMSADGHECITGNHPECNQS